MLPSVPIRYARSVGKNHNACRLGHTPYHIQKWATQQPDDAGRRRSRIHSRTRPCLLPRAQGHCKRDGLVSICWMLMQSCSSHCAARIRHSDNCTFLVVGRCVQIQNQQKSGFKTDREGDGARNLRRVPLLQERCKSQYVSEYSMLLATRGLHAASGCLINR